MMINQNPKKLLFLTNSLDAGGTERLIFNIADYHYKKGYEVHIVCFNATEASHTLDKGITFHNLLKGPRKSGLFYHLWDTLKIFVKLPLILQSKKPCCVVSFASSGNLSVGLSCSILNFPYVLYEQSAWPSPKYRFNPFMHWISHSVYRNAKSIVLPSKARMDKFRRIKYLKRLTNFEVIDHPIPIFPKSDFSSVYPHRFILGVGKLSRKKGFDLLIAAFRRLEEKNIHLLICGEGEQREALETQIEHLGLAHRIKLMGYRKNIQDYYRQAEVIVLSSREENYPNVILEALSLGKPCIATNCSNGLSDLIKHGKNGLLIKPCNIYHLAYAIHMILDDPIFRSKITYHAKEMRSSNAPENTLVKWTALFQ